MYLAFVKFDLICKEFERQFHEYFDEHVREWALRPGCSRAWRSREYRGGPNEGLLEQEFWNIYQVADPAMFTSKPGPTPLPTEKQPWLRDRSNWGRLFYRILSYAEQGRQRGKCWLRYEFDYRGAPAAEAAFRTDYGKYIAQMTSLPAIHRAWQLEYVPHELQIGRPAAAKYMSLFEIDAPENVFDAGRGQELFSFRNPEPGAVVPVARHFARLLADVAALDKQ